MSSLSGTQLASSGKNRRELDYYPTPPAVTQALVDFLGFEKSQPMSIWEPACGNGAMSDVIAPYARSLKSSDIRETGYGEGSINFLDTHHECDAIITNPPFVTSAEFIEHARRQQPRLVAMLLKSQYWHAKKRTDLFFNNPPAWVLPLTWRPDFMGGERGGAPTMEVHWTVWVAGDTQTKYRPLNRPSKKGGTA